LIVAILVWWAPVSAAPADGLRGGRGTPRGHVKEQEDGPAKRKARDAEREALFRPGIVSATVRVDATKAAERADIRLVVRLHVGRAETVELVRADLMSAPVYDDRPVVRLDVAFPPVFQRRLEAGEVRLVELEVRGPTNREMAGLCGQSWYLFVEATSTEVAAKAGITRPYKLTVVC
jgi:hypothetical protein